MGVIKFPRPEREFRYGTGRVRHQSALDMMMNQRSGTVGAYITDPPFFVGISRDGGGVGADPWVNISTMDDMIAWSQPLANQIYRTLRPGGASVFMGGSHSISAWEVAAQRAGLKWMAELTVLWNTGKPRNRNFGSLTTTIRWHVRPGARYTFNGTDFRSIYSNVLVATKVPRDEKVHPAQKPVELTNVLVSLLTHEEDLVIDPFCGSGSTLVSAAICGRNFLGCDLDIDNCNIANIRAMQAELEEANLKPIYLWVNGKLTEIAA